MTIDRSELSRLLAKAIAYKQTGCRENEAREAAKALVRALQLADLLK